MDAFCGGKEFWNANLTWREGRILPEFTECFRDTVLIWIATGWLTVSLPFYLMHILQYGLAPVANSSRNLFKLCLVALQVSLCMREYYSRTAELELKGEQLIKSYVWAPLTEALTLVVVGITVEVERIQGVNSSSLLFVYWLLAAVTKFIPLYTLLIHQAYEEKLLTVGLATVSYCLLLVQLILSRLVESDGTSKRCSQSDAVRKVTPPFPPK